MSYIHHRSIQYLEAIKSSVAELADFDSAQTLLNHIVAAVQRELNFYIASIFRYEPAHKHVILVAQEGHGNHPAPIGYVQPIESGIVGLVIRSAQTTRIDDIRQCANYVAPEGYDPAAAELCVPILSAGAVWGAFNVESCLAAAFSDDDQLALEVIAAQLGSALHSLALRAELQARIEDLSIQSKEQAQLLAEVQRLGTPVFPIFAGGLALPLIGTLDNSRMLRVSNALLSAIQRTRSHIALLDITGIVTMDQAIAQQILQLSTMTRLLGTELVLTGVRPDVTYAFINLKADLRNLQICQDFASGLRYALQAQQRIL